MQFNFATLAALAAALTLAAPPALAADCAPTSGCSFCEDRHSWFAASDDFCGGDGWTHPGQQTWGWGQIWLDGQFDTQQECRDGFQQIVDQCLGFWNGGSYNYNSASLHILFCKCGNGEGILGTLSHLPDPNALFNP
ncbi:hypothetical protein BC628DRAFT_1108622 [Trametes gibbosa]|nr:hypothetical protein BC628DRAFT_1108622 [Trametes gibbosa]